MRHARPLLVLLTILSAGCGVTTRHVAVLADTAIYEAMNEIHASEQLALCGQRSCAGISARVTPEWTDAKSQDFNQRLLPGAVAGKEFNSVLSSWMAGQPMPVMLHNLVVSLTSSLAAVVSSFPDGSTKTVALANIAKGQAIVLSALDLLLSIGGN